MPWCGRGARIFLFLVQQFSAPILTRLVRGGGHTGSDGSESAFWLLGLGGTKESHGVRLRRKKNSPAFASFFSYAAQARQAGGGGGPRGATLAVCVPDTGQGLDFLYRSGGERVGRVLLQVGHVWRDRKLLEGGKTPRGLFEKNVFAAVLFFTPNLKNLPTFGLSDIAGRQFNRGRIVYCTAAWSFAKRSHGFRPEARSGSEPKFVLLFLAGL